MNVKQGECKLCNSQEVVVFDKKIKEDIQSAFLVKEKWKSVQDMKEFFICPTCTFKVHLSSIIHKNFKKSKKKTRKLKQCFFCDSLGDGILFSTGDNPSNFKKHFIHFVEAIGDNKKIDYIYGKLICSECLFAFVVWGKLRKQVFSVLSLSYNNNDEEEDEESIKLTPQSFGNEFKKRVVLRKRRNKENQIGSLKKLISQRKIKIKINNDIKKDDKMYSKVAYVKIERCGELNEEEICCISDDDLITPRLSPIMSSIRRTNLRSHLCNICDKSFRLKCDYLSHILKHEKFENLIVNIEKLKVNNPGNLEPSTSKSSLSGKKVFKFKINPNKKKLHLKMNADEEEETDIEIDVQNEVVDEKKESNLDEEDEMNDDEEVELESLRLDNEGNKEIEVVSDVNSLAVEVAPDTSSLTVEVGERILSSDEHQNDCNEEEGIPKEIDSEERNKEKNDNDEPLRLESSEEVNSPKNQSLDEKKDEDKVDESEGNEPAETSKRKLSTEDEEVKSVSQETVNESQNDTDSTEKNQESQKTVSTLPDSDMDDTFINESPEIIEINIESDKVPEDNEINEMEVVAFDELKNLDDAVVWVNDKHVEASEEGKKEKDDCNIENIEQQEQNKRNDDKGNDHGEDYNEGNDDERNDNEENDDEGNDNEENDDEGNDNEENDDEGNDNEENDDEGNDIEENDNVGKDNEENDDELNEETDDQSDETQLKNAPIMTNEDLLNILEESVSEKSEKGESMKRKRGYSESGDDFSSNGDDQGKSCIINIHDDSNEETCRSAGESSKISEDSIRIEFKDTSSVDDAASMRSIKTKYQTRPRSGAQKNQSVDTEKESSSSDEATQKNKRIEEDDEWLETDTKEESSSTSIEDIFTDDLDKVVLESDQSSSLSQFTKRNYRTRNQKSKNLRDTEFSETATNVESSSKDLSWEEISSSDEDVSSEDSEIKSSKETRDVSSRDESSELELLASSSSSSVSDEKELAEDCDEAKPKKRIYRTRSFTTIQKYQNKNDNSSNNDDDLIRNDDANKTLQKPLNRKEILIHSNITISKRNDQNESTQSAQKSKLKKSKRKNIESDKDSKEENDSSHDDFLDDDTSRNSHLEIHTPDQEHSSDEEDIPKSTSKRKFVIDDSESVDTDSLQPKKRNFKRICLADDSNRDDSSLSNDKWIDTRISRQKTFTINDDSSQSNDFEINVELNQFSHDLESTDVVYVPFSPEKVVVLSDSNSNLSECSTELLDNASILRELEMDAPSPVLITENDV